MPGGKCGKLVSADSVGCKSRKTCESTHLEGIHRDVSWFCVCDGGFRTEWLGFQVPRFDFVIKFGHLVFVGSGLDKCYLGVSLKIFNGFLGHLVQVEQQFVDFLFDFSWAQNIRGYINNAPVPKCTISEAPLHTIQFIPLCASFLNFLVWSSSLCFSRCAADILRN